MKLSNIKKTLSINYFERFHLKICLGYNRKLKEVHWLVMWFELSPFGYKNDNCNLQVLQFYAHNVCMVYNIKEMDLNIFNFWWSFGVLTIKDILLI
jgi:hypothetical protein